MLQAVVNSLRIISFSSWARRAYSASGRNRAFSTRAASCDLERLLMYSMAASSQDHMQMSAGIQLTFGENFPLAGLAAGRIWENHVQLVKQTLHLASPLPLRHLVAYAKLWGSAVVAATSGESCCVVGSTLQASDAAMLH
jgi:hypothetical protein